MNSDKRTSTEHRIALVVAHMDLVCAERNYAHNRATSLEKQVAELQAEVARLKANIGCAREQGSTQYCAEVLERDKRIAELEEALVRIASLTMSQVVTAQDGFTRCREMAYEAFAKKGQP